MIIDNTSNSQTSEYDAWALIYEPAGKLSKLCIGVMLLDRNNKRAFVSHIKNSVISQGVLHIEEDFDPEWVMGMFKSRLETVHELNTHLIGDSYYGLKSIGSCIYIRGIGELFSVTADADMEANEVATDYLKRDSLFYLKDADISSFTVEGVEYGGVEEFAEALKELIISGRCTE